MSDSAMPPQPGFRVFLAYPFQGTVWMRQWLFYSLILTLLTLLFQPLASVIEMGFAFQVARQVLLHGERPALPGRVPAGILFRDGLRWYLVRLLYNLPALIVIAAAGGWLIVHYGLPQRGVPWPGLAQGWPVLVISILLAGPLAILGGWLSNIAVMNMARTDALSAAFRLDQWGRVLVTHLGAFLRIMILMLAIGLALSLAQFLLSIPAAVLVVLPVFIGAVISLYQRLVSIALYAGAYRQAVPRS